MPTWMLTRFIWKNTCTSVGLKYKTWKNETSFILDGWKSQRIFRTRKCDIEDEMADAKKTTDALRKENDAVNKKVKVLKNQLQEKL